MILFKEINRLKNYLQLRKRAEKKIGFVPTMGALHEGHLSLIKQCRQASDIVVCSIFVNPVQFNDPKDFEKYPVTIEKDIFLLEKNLTDVLFLPSVEEMYPDGIHTKMHYTLGHLENVLEGLYRPGHFQGVCKAVHRLLEIVKPDDLWLGQKDYQQSLVIKKMIRDININVQVKIGATTREANGLAMSSRNMRLTPEQCEMGTAIYKALLLIKENLHNTSIPVLKRAASQIIMSAGFEKIDYVEVCNASTLLPIAVVSYNTSMIALAAAFINGVRLIDNMPLN